MKKYNYDFFEINDIWMDEIKVEYPDADAHDKFKTLTPEERLVLFSNFVNRLGKKGWRLLNPVSAVLGNGSYHVFEKEEYAR